MFYEIIRIFDWFKHGSERPDDGSDQEHLFV